MATGCTMGKRNIDLAGAPPAEDCLFEVTFEGEGKSLHVRVPLAVKERFAGWMADHPADEWLFEQTCAEPAQTLWEERAASG